jgi:hypothetical protein
VSFDMVSLDIDFAARRPWVVTQVIACGAADPAGAPAPEEDVWRWTLPRRMQALLAAARASGAARVFALARCPRPECGERTEIELELDSLALAPGPDSFSWQGEGSRLTLRLPRGDDQRRWLEAPPPDAPELPLQMATGLVCEVDGAPREAAWRLPEPWLQGVEDAFAEHDPLTALSIAAACSGCGGELSAEIDLEELLLQELERAQQDLLSDVHTLASAYHWSEAEILGLPAWRRASYLAALRAQA